MLRNKTMRNNLKPEDKLILKASADPKYKGRQIVVVGKEIHVLTTKNKKERAKLLTSLVRKYPTSTPTITYIPKDNTLILIL